jgi:hypothetical protein
VDCKKQRVTKHYTSLELVKENEMGGACSMHGKIKISIGKPEGRNVFRKRRCGSEDNIRIDLKERGQKDVY